MRCEALWLTTRASNCDDLVGDVQPLCSLFENAARLWILQLVPPAAAVRRESLFVIEVESGSFVKQQSQPR
jgi:hypothetical protein